MQQARKKKRRARRTPRRDIAASAYRRLERVAMRPDDSLFVVAAIAGVVFVSWLISSLWR